MNSFFHRRSIRQFTDQPVSKEQIETILKAAMAAPTAGNDRQWEFYVITNPALIEKLSQIHPYAGPARNAPVCIVPVYHTDGCNWPMYGQINTALAAQNMMLAADEIGLGSVYLGIAPQRERMDALNELLDLPENVEAFGIFPVGYPAKEPAPKETFEPAKIHYVE